MASRASTRFSFDLARWPSFWYQVTQFLTRPRNHQDEHFEQYLWWLFKKCDLWSFLLIWPGDLVFDPMWPSFKLDLEIIKTNILSKIHDDCFKNVTTRVLTKFSADFAWWPSFLPQVTQFQTWPNLQVTSMLPSKFGVSWPFGSGEEAKNRFSRWPPWQPSWISDRHDFSYFWSTSHLDAS